MFVVWREAKLNNSGRRKTPATCTCSLLFGCSEAAHHQGAEGRARCESRKRLTLSFEDEENGRD